MEQKLRETGKPHRFETTNICLGAALLASVRGSSLFRISTSPSMDGKRTLTITYPAEQESTAKQVIEEFLQRRLTVPLYLYNVSLNSLRDQLHQQTTGERRYDRRVESTIP